MRIMGVDPGLSALGFGIVDKDGDRLRVVSTGTIQTKPAWGFPGRLQYLHDRVRSVIDEFKPEALVMEKPIFCQNIKTALTLGQAGGMAVLAAAETGLQFYEFTPLEVKKAVTGNGRAAKDQVSRMVQVLLAHDEPLDSEHVSDALACAICYAHSEKQLRWMR